MTTTTPSRFGLLIDDHRKRNGLSIRALSICVGVTDTTMGNLIRGRSSGIDRMWWVALVVSLPGLTMEAIEEAHLLSATHRIHVNDSPEADRELAAGLVWAVRAVEAGTLDAGAREALCAVLCVPRV